MLAVQHQRKPIRQSDVPNPCHQFEDVGQGTQINLDSSTFSDLSEMVPWISGLRKILRPLFRLSGKLGRHQLPRVVMDTEHA